MCYRRWRETLAPVTEAIVIVPGIYTPRFVLLPLAHRFKQQGYNVTIARHRYLMLTPKQNAESLYKQIQHLHNPAVHLVGHSLGGVVILHLLNIGQDNTRELPIKRVVLLGVPVLGSVIARKIHARRWARWLLGKSVVSGLLHGVPAQNQSVGQPQRDIGVLFGTVPAGLSSILFRLRETGDGVVLAAETRLSTATDRASIPHSHAIMLFSKVAADKTLQFIRTGQFLSD